MLNLSIMPLDAEHIDEICEDVIRQQREGVSSCAMFMMMFAPEGDPTFDKAEGLCKTYDLFRARLDAANARHGVLVQSTMGHVTLPSVRHSFQNVVSLVDGSVRESTCCPLDGGFRYYIKEQMRVLAAHKPSLVMIDDDVGLLYRPQKGCACPLHMVEFNHRANTNMTREQLYAHTQGKSQKDKYYTDIYVKLQEDTLVGAVRAMRDGIDEVDPSIYGAVSGISTGAFCEFTDRIVDAFAGNNNPKIVRMNNGMYATEGGRGFTVRMYRAAMLKEFLKGKVDILLAETDTCPHNRYSTSAALLHAHFTGTILEGAKGAKHWITRTRANEPDSGKAYRKVLGKYSRFYEKLADYTDILHPVGCRIPLSLVQDYVFVPADWGLFPSPWSTCVLERLGLPLYFSNEEEGAVFLDDISVSKFTDEQIKEFFKGTLVLSAVAAKKLNERGFSDFIGVDVEDWKGKKVCFEMIDGHRIANQVGMRRLVVKKEGVLSLSHAIYETAQDGVEELFPAVTGFENPLGGYTVVFCGTPDAPFHYTTAFSMLNETRKKQLVKILEKQDNLPIYYPDDAEVYIRAGQLESGELFCAFFNLGMDVLEDIPLVIKKKVSKIEALESDGSRAERSFYEDGAVIRVEQEAGTLIPVILFIS